MVFIKTCNLLVSCNAAHLVRFIARVLLTAGCAEIRYWLALFSADNTSFLPCSLPRNIDDSVVALTLDADKLPKDRPGGTSLEISDIVKLLE